ncbi:hypothetical protein DR62_07395 [Burkholderia thailandensis]|uniref:Uncharacterized protein n=1 Tax=Burkholderia thailandensis TaxID=57975 RepID=A0AAW9CJP2_BURTH|nr:hypothetical protein DR62_07395 [Burkholderia thailandensis]AOI54890.1 hypothetical protein WI24_24110 [Burkholderia thailandensis]AOJ48089.1 hypothetical protein WJ27_23570 [Burkholderia thailandensis]AOJ53676.1 hypothetical protein AQ475_22930 [Burkholderia thailandensis]AOJ59816.1 hypothetical protein AQ477_25225 [Burkholderia thailandensis]
MRRARKRHAWRLPRPPRIAAGAGIDARHAPSARYHDDASRRPPFDAPARGIAPRRRIQCVFRQQRS